VEIRVLVERRIEIRDVGLMMFAVVYLHRLRVDVGLERVETIGELRKFVGHGNALRDEGGLILTGE
jgi:hypothetical protein